MKDIYLVNYSVKGIKSLDKLISLSFYKKTISKNLDTQEYNIKGIYGMNGSGKSGIITSIDILRNILTQPEYLSNPIVQKNLDAIINKQIGELFIEADFIVNLGEPLLYFRYGLALSKNKTGKYIISYERLESKRATLRTDSLEPVFKVANGEIDFFLDKDYEDFSEVVLKKTVNLLDTASLCALFFEKIFIPEKEFVNQYKNIFSMSLLLLYIFGKKLHVYLDQSDDHRDYLVKKSLEYMNGLENSGSGMDALLDYLVDTDTEHLNVIDVSGNIVPKNMYERFEKTVENLYEFLHIFKIDLQNIEIDRKEDKDVYICSLIMVYESYRIHAEFESTGIKKLIRLFTYLREMVHGGIVFIDEFDSNLHDVYLCALLEYLMEYGEGQLCFTTHNVGPMDILKQRKKSIDFLSFDHQIYPWTKSGNYSPAKLYRNGMIEGSPFNVDSIDFIGVFGLDEEDE